MASRNLISLLLLLGLLLAGSLAKPDDSDDHKSSAEEGKDLAEISDRTEKWIHKLWGDSESVEAFIASFAVIFVSEIGDKTFFIAAILAMRNSRVIVFAGAISALGIMTVLSAALGYAVPNLIPRSVTQYVASILFFGMGIKMLREGWEMSPNEGSHELEEVQNELNEKEKTGDDKMEEGTPSKTPKQDSNFSHTLKNIAVTVFSPLFVQTFTLTFLAEWGDRSQIATIVLAAAQNVFWVTIGAILGHALCSAGAVIGGRLLASKISVRTVTLVGAVLFIVFGLSSFYSAIKT